MSIFPKTQYHDHSDSETSQSWHDWSHRPVQIHSYFSEMDLFCFLDVLKSKETVSVNVVFMSGHFYRQTGESVRYESMERPAEPAASHL